ncbi:hypothetical protein Y032_0011g1476 [Ancylostoma ceylanicum]|uniref:Stathmin n=1 Tax=Ancylostoma ceylanicum TaxID=53326 RepID=A0A016VEV2_9BILA|nr:hypothetical protein Y032_0011g1476 [Ancylostoma ceylanicum]
MALVARPVVKDSEEVPLETCLRNSRNGQVRERTRDQFPPHTRLEELRRRAEHLDERAKNEKTRRKEEHEMFVGKLRDARSAVSAEQMLTEKYKQENVLLAKDLGRLRWSISQSQVESCRLRSVITPAVMTPAFIAPCG